MEAKALRKFYIYKLERDWPAVRYNRKRKLNRLSTKQLEAKLKQMQRMLTRRTAQYVDYIDGKSSLAREFNNRVVPATGKLTRLMETCESIRRAK